MKTKIVAFGVIALISSLLQAEPVIEMPKSGWYINNFGVSNSGGSFEYLTAPDGSTAIKVKFFGEKRSNLVMSKDDVKRQCSFWPAKFSDLKGYFWNDGCTNIINLALLTKNGQWNARIILQHTGWRPILITELVNYQNKFITFNPQEVSTFFISAEMGSKNGEFAIGTLYWDEPATSFKPLLRGRVGNMFRISEPLTIDGQLSEAAWNNIPQIKLEHFAHNKPDTSATGNWVKVAFDNTNIYIAAFMPITNGAKLKATLREDNTELWDEDDFEFFLYPEPDIRQFFQFITSPLGTQATLARIFDQVEDCIVSKFKDLKIEWQTRAATNEASWIVEAAVPWSSIGAQKIPSLLQFQAMRIDYSKGAFICPVWSPVLRAPTEGFGILLPQDSSDSEIKVETLTCNRSKEDEITLSFFVDGTNLPDDVKAECWYTVPGISPSYSCTNFSLAGKAKHLLWQIKSGPAVNGMHQIVLMVTSTGLVTRCGGSIFYFNQTLPSRFKYDDVVFNPEPKRITWDEGKFIVEKGATISLPTNATSRTIKTAEYLAERIYGIYGIHPEIRQDGRGSIKLSIDTSLVKEAAGSNISIQEAYILKVSPSQITITGGDEAGLYYGIVTFLQAASSTKLPHQPIPCFSVIDYPSYEKRIVTTYEMFHNKKARDDNHGGYQIEKIKQWIERYVAGNKYNFLCLSWADQVNYPSVPEFYHKDNFSPEEVAELYTFAREHFIHAFPGMLFGAHSPSITRHFPELIEQKFGPTQMDITDERTYELMKKLFNDLLDIAGKDAKFFNTFNDEWWHGARKQEDVIYKGKTRQELFYNFLMQEYSLLKERGVKMVMFSDMLHPLHNGGAPFNLSAVASNLPRDIILATWSAQSDEYFAKLGFEELWNVRNGFSPSFNLWSGDKGYGRIHYGSADLFNQTLQERTLAFGLHTEFQAANYAWNKDEKGILPNAEWTLQYMPSLMGVYAMRPNPFAGTNLITYPLSNACYLVENIAFSNETCIGGIPMKLGALLIEPATPLKISFSTPQHISALYILNNVSPSDQESVKKLQKVVKENASARPYGPIVGSYVLTYSDGTKLKLMLRLGRNIALLKYTPSESRYVRDCRAVFSLNGEQSLALNQYEWINLFPEKEVVSLKITSIYDFAPILIGGITVRDIANSIMEEQK
jgi:hypothetical protein